MWRRYRVWAVRLRRTALLAGAKEARERFSPIRGVGASIAGEFQSFYSIGF